jgi:SAM-dependent methyltransferase
MTIDEALEAVRQTEQCWIVFSSVTGEVLSVEGVGHDESSAEVIAHLQELSRFAQPVMTRYFISADVTRQVLEQQRAETERVRTRGQVLTAWSAAPVEELLQVLERGQYDYPMGKDFDSTIIVDHLWQVHRDELTPSIRERLRALPVQNVLCAAAGRKLGIYLAAFDGDAARLKAIWTGAKSGRYGWEDTIALTDSFAYLQIHDPEIIRDLIAVFDTNMPFGGKCDAMIALGRIGSAAGIEATHMIRRKVYDSEPWIIATRDRVLERLETASEQWKRCGECCYGRVHNQGEFGERLCLACYGIGFLPLGTAQSQTHDA